MSFCVGCIFQGAATSSNSCKIVKQNIFSQFINCNPVSSSACYFRSGNYHFVSRLQESQISQNSSEILPLCISYKFVQESQILQICYNVEHFLQDSDNISANCIFALKNSSKNVICNFGAKIRTRR